MWTPFRIIVNRPNSHNVGSGPAENINRNMIDATNVRTPFVRGRVQTVANDNNIIVQISQDKWWCNSEHREKLIY